MPYALSTTKRKFHRILDSISNASSTSLATQDDQNNVSTVTLPPNLESPAKKLRLTRPKSALAQSTNIDAPNQVSSFRSSSKRQSALPAMNEERKPPNFAPWDRTQFLERLKSFRHVDRWMGKPEKISEVQWAKRGWTCVGKERVGCVGGCGKEVVIKLEDDGEEREREENEGSGSEDQGWREDAQEQLIEKYAEMIAAAHEGGCLWRRRGCDDSIYRLPLAHRATTLENLRLRYESLAAMSSDLPSSLSTPSAFTLTSLSDYLVLVPNAPSIAATTTSAAPSPTESSSTPSINREALTLALFGWQAEPSPIPGLATCHACFRRLGLWLFKSASPPSSPSMTRLDVVAEHRDYCPWVNSDSQSLVVASHDQHQLNPPGSSTSGLAGWEILSRVVNTSAQLSRIENGARPISPTEVNGVDRHEESEAVVVLDEIGNNKATDAKDRERWAKLKKLRQVFHVKRGKGKGAGEKQKEKEKEQKKEKERLKGKENVVEVVD
ncbi:hypothetical protein MMC07_000198 [Pseudocyphellaria aurata]|nr:hypothetical protein [Pseudocyphellaria aurata]